MNEASSKRVLVVDDDPDLADVVTMALEFEGYQTVVAHHGHEALEKLDRETVDLILLDMRMPVMNGWEFARRVRDTAARAVPLVVITAAENAEQWAHEVGAAAWITKPFDIDTLLERVQFVLGDR